LTGTIDYLLRLPDLLEAAEGFAFAFGFDFDFAFPCTLADCWGAADAEAAGLDLSEGFGFREKSGMPRAPLCPCFSDGGRWIDGRAANGMVR
jgi:hypothetical protein